MKFTVNIFARKCTKNECECKSCSFNGIEGMCLGCNECIEHKLLAPVSNCSIVKKGTWSGFGAIAFNNQYMICVPMGVADIPEYFHITKDEYDTFDDWKDNSAKIIKIQVREGKGGLKR